MDGMESGPGLQLVAVASGDEARELATESTTLASNRTRIRTRCAHNIQFKFNVMVIPVEPRQQSSHRHRSINTRRCCCCCYRCRRHTGAHMVHRAPSLLPHSVQFVIQLFMYIIIVPPQCTSHALCCPFKSMPPMTDDVRRTMHDLGSRPSHQSIAWLGHLVCMSGALAGVR